ncbi:hypothetical protein EDC04DRAFT_3146280, partial [Pisolithus marmoratus]
MSQFVVCTDKADRARTIASQPPPSHRRLLTEQAQEGITPIRYGCGEPPIVAFPPPITHLPLELLTQILDLAIHDDMCDKCNCGNTPNNQKRRFASVSRRWRDTILSSPHLWTSIRLCPDESLSWVKVHIQRSRACRVDIYICTCWCWVSRVEDKLCTFLDVAVSCAERWHSVTIPMAFNLASTLRGLEHYTFPSLTRFVCGGDLVYPAFLLPEKAPALEYLAIERLKSTQELSIPPKVFTLILKTNRFIFDGHLLYVSLRSDEMTTLVLIVHDRELDVELSSLYFPRLTSLQPQVNNPTEILHHMVAPKLTRFTYSPSFSYEAVTTVFSLLEGKFPNVTDLVFTHYPMAPRTSCCEYQRMGRAIAAAFPGVRSLTPHVRDIPVFFGFDGEADVAADLWDQLQDLTLEWLV